jgi:hypothetical protein
MDTLSYEAQQRRLRVVGSCGNDDAPRIHDAVLSLARRGGTLIVDLTAVTEVTSEVGRALLTAQEAADRCRVTLIRKSGSPVDTCLRAAQPAARSGSRRAMTGVDSTPCTRTEATMVKDTVDHSQSAPSSGASPAAYAR